MHFHARVETLELESGQLSCCATPSATDEANSPIVKYVLNACHDALPWLISSSLDDAFTLMPKLRSPRFSTKRAMIQREV